MTTLTGDYFEDVILDNMVTWPEASIQYFFIPGEPVPNERPRIMTAGEGKNRKSWAFTPSTTMKARQKIFNSVVQQQRGRIEPPYSVAIKFVLSREQKDADVDNLCKNVMDALFSNKKSIPPMPFKDDKNIKNIVCFKRVGDKPGIHLWVMKA